MSSGKLNPITVSVVLNAFRNIVNEMNSTLFRSAASPVITEGRDIGGAVFDAEGRLVSQGDWDLAVFVGMLEYSCKAILESETLRPGDVFITNDPFTGGTHFNDVEIIKPVFVDDDLLGFLAIVGHWPDIGGAVPGSLAPDAEEYFAEGVRIPPIKLYDQGHLNPGVLKLLLSNVRNSKDREGDLVAQVAAVNKGEERIKALIDRYGVATLRECQREGILYSEKLLRARFKEMRNGAYTWTDWLDVRAKQEPEPAKIQLTLTIDGDEAIFDFTGSDPQCPSGTNATYSSTASAVFVITKSLFPEIPMNHGCLAPIKLIIPEGTVVNASPPAAVSAMACSVYEKVVGVVLGAFAQVVPERVMACPYNLINLTLGGINPRTHEYYVAYLFSEGGFGGRAGLDGDAGLVSLYGGGARITPVEVFEKKYPLMFMEWGLEPDSGGPGKWRGGVGSRKTFRLTAGEAKLTVLGDRGKYPAWGLFGGKPGAPQRLILNIGTPGERGLSLRTSGYELKEGETVTILSGGGGGYGPPWERDPTKVLEDVREGYVSIRQAKEAYGVVIKPDSLTIDEEATLKLRENLRWAKGGTNG